MKDDIDVFNDFWKTVENDINYKNIPDDLLRKAKQYGFSDIQLARLLNKNENLPLSKLAFLVLVRCRCLAVPMHCAPDLAHAASSVSLLVCH